MSRLKSSTIIAGAVGLLLATLGLSAYLVHSTRSSFERGAAAPLTSPCDAVSMSPAPPAQASKIPPAPAPLDEKQARILSLRQAAAEKERSGDLLGAIELADQALRLEPENQLAQREMSHYQASMGWKSFEAKDFHKSRGFFEEALYYWSDNEEAVRGMGFACFEDRDRAKAEEWLKRYVQLGGGRPDAYNLLGRIYYESGRGEQALPYLENSLALSPEQPQVAQLADKIRRELRVEAGFFESETSHFLIKYEGREVPEAGRVVMVICEEAYLMVGRRLGYYPDDQVPVILYTDEQFQDVTRSPAWAGAIFDAKIRIPAKGLRQRTEVLERLIFHEYTHALVHNISQGRAPLWFHEGLAQMSEELPLDEYALAAKVVAAGGPVPLSRLEGSFMGLPLREAQTAYAESWLAVQYLYDRYGQFSVRELLGFLAEGDNISAAVPRLTARDYAVFDREFQDFVKAAAQDPAPVSPAQP